MQTTAIRPNIAQRLASVRQNMRAAGIDALLVTNPENRRYVTDFNGHDDRADSAGRVLITADRIRLLTDSRYSEQAREESPGVEVSDERGKLPDLVAATLRDWNLPGSGQPLTLGIEATHLTVAQYTDLRAANQEFYQVRAVQDIVEPLRARKDDAEIAATRKATDITAQTFAHLREFLRQPGLTEQRVTAEIIATMLRLGAEETAFASIVAAGPMAARPHAIPGDRELLPNQPIIIDMGARYGGYCADMTRTVFLDGVPDIWRDRYNHVLAAVTHAEQNIHAGLSGKAGDALARDYLTSVGLGEQFTHGLGHGTGLEIHEDPRMGQQVPDDHILPEGAIITIEPGVYFPGEGGIRIEDAVVLTATGCDVLTTAPKDLETMIIQRQE